VLICTIKGKYETLGLKQSHSISFYEIVAFFALRENPGRIWEGGEVQFQSLSCEALAQPTAQLSQHIAQANQTAMHQVNQVDHLSNSLLPIYFHAVQPIALPVQNIARVVLNTAQIVLNTAQIVHKTDQTIRTEHFI